MLDGLESVVASILLAIGLFIVFGGFFGRELFNISFSWTDEVARYLLIWITYIGAAAVAREGGHIRVEVLIGLLPDRVRRIADVISHLLSLVFTVAVFVSSVKYVHEAWKTGLMTAESTLFIPKWTVLAVIPIGFFLMSVRLAVRAWQTAVPAHQEPQ